MQPSKRLDAKSSRDSQVRVGERDRWNEMDTSTGRTATIIRSPTMSAPRRQRCLTIRVPFPVTFVIARAPFRAGL